MTKNQFLVYITGIMFFITCQQKTESGQESEKQKPNILFIAVDDLRSELGCYGNEQIKTPNLDQLASDGVLFTNHFVQVPTCGASRYCLLTGMRPKTRAHLYNNIFENEVADKPEGSLPESFIHHLRRNGYYTVGIGKISHSADGLVYGYNDAPSDKRELPYSWHELVFDSSKWKSGWNAFFGYANGENRQSMNKQVKPYEAGNVGDDGYVDGITTQLALNKLRELKQNNKPFFMGLGFFKPHLPFNSPDTYWDLYTQDSIHISPNPFIPHNVNIKSLHESSEFNQYELGDEKAGLDHPVSDAYARKLRQAYYACVSYIDQQIGMLIDEIHALDLDENTIIIVWGDHGWHLGDQQMWGKHTLFENALRSTLIIKVPGKNNNGKVINSIVETVDIYPSILELCNIKAPYVLDGESFINVMIDQKARQNNVAYSYFRNGISLRTDQYRLTKYFRQEEPKIELYDHLDDPYETNNIASDNLEIVNKLMPLLEEGNTGIYETN